MCSRKAAYGALVCAFLLCSARAEPDRLTAAIDNNRRVLLAGHVHPLLHGATDLGPMEPSAELPHLTLLLKPSAAQQTDLEQLLARQQDPASPDYHRWLPPEEYAARFGVSQADIDKIAAWLRQQGLTVLSVARARNAIDFRGSVSQIERAFAPRIHRYQVNGQAHYANAVEPTIPAALDGVAAAIRGLHDFRLRPSSRRSLHPRDTLFDGSHQLAPDDFATIYDLQPLYAAGINGAGQKLAVAGQTQIELSDIQQFRSHFNLPANDPQVLLVPNTRDPGISHSDLSEADLDIELSGAVARNASIIYVYSLDVMDALTYAIDQNLAPVVSISYGSCELQTSTVDANSMRSLAQQGNAQGITWVSATGDSGAADCFGGNSPETNDSMSVDLPAGVPEVTGVGGTEFNEGSVTYWSSTDTANHASALSYIPEMAWNDSAMDGTPSAGGGGASTLFTKPSWQTGPGVPNDGARDVPDVSLSASADHDGYEIFSGGSVQVVGGTSVGAPSMAGIAALLNQYLVANGIQASPGLGNINPRLYALGQTSAIHDITTGNNMVVPCGPHNLHCMASPIGYDAGPGYDQATGLGSIDAYNLITAWGAGASTGRGAVTLSASASTGNITFSDTVTVTVTVAGSNAGTPTGTVAFSLAGGSLGTATLSGNSGTANATLKLAGFQLAAGANTIAIQYNGDNSYLEASTSVAITITSAAIGTPAINGVANGASFAQAFAPGGILSIFGTQLAPATGIALSVPLPSQLAGVTVSINGQTAPLYYVSSTQLNVQIPYGLPANSMVALAVDNNGQSGSSSFLVSGAAPGIFTFQGGAPVPYVSGKQGQEIVLYLTGAGAVTPFVATGAAPVGGTPLAGLPVPQGSVSVTVGNIAAKTYFAGIPWGLVGVLQINYQVPPTAPLGPQPVVVTIGGVASQPATLQVTQ